MKSNLIGEDYSKIKASRNFYLSVISIISISLNFSLMNAKVGVRGDFPKPKKNAPMINKFPYWSRMLKQTIVFVIEMF